MNIEQLINKDAEKYSPYMNGFVNHLPMGQFALYKLTNDIESVAEYTDYYFKTSNINKVKEKSIKVNSLEECLGERTLYKPCLDLIREMLKEEDLEELVSTVLNNYTLSLASGLFHTTIRLAYAMEGYKLDGELQAEVERALAYYITAYREDGLFDRGIPANDSMEEMKKLIGNAKIREIRNSGISRNEKLKAFYNNEELFKQGFTIEGRETQKVKGLLQILIPAFYNSNNIVMLHTITGLQAVVTLQDYFEDYERALDILTTTAIAHILMQEDLDISTEDTDLNKSWEEISELVASSKDVHTLKFGYTSRKLDNMFKVPDLKYATYKRVVNEK